METTKRYVQYSLTEISELVRTKQVSPVQLTKEMLEEIEKKNPQLNAYITVNEAAALQAAEKAEREIADGHYRGPLHGIPVGVKDLIETKDLKTTMGSWIYREYIPTKNAAVMDRLEEAGAILLGKHNTHEFAYGPTGDRSYFGPVRNPHDTTRMTGGSSSGTGAAVAAELCYAGIGTDTGGSIRIPASFCGIVGMKPTSGLVSTEGAHPVSERLDHLGPMTKTVRDNALFLNAIVAKDHEAKQDFSRLIGKSIADFTIGVPTNFYFDNVDAEVQEKITAAMEKLKQAGATVKEVTIPCMEEFLDAQRTIMRYEAYRVHEENVATHSEHIDEEVLERILSGKDTSRKDYEAAIKMRERSKMIFGDVLSVVDSLLAPTVAILPQKINDREIKGLGGKFTHLRWIVNRLCSPTNLNGFPSMSVPVGFSKAGLPIGAQLIGKPYDEARLYQIAAALED